jgi:micrococcal nuclease
MDELSLNCMSVSNRLTFKWYKDGQAVVYRQYLKGCAATEDQYLQAEVQARQGRLGFWNQQSPIMPWDYRQGKRRGNSQ